MKRIWLTTTIFFLLIFAAWFAIIKLGQEHVTPNPVAEKIKSPVQPGDEYIQYWLKDGHPIMLLGGSDEDNLFQMENVSAHLDLLQSVGGNYVRNTMSSRDEGNVWPFGRNEEGMYNLNTWNDEYWNRLDHFLAACQEREIIVQMELWATFDFYRDNWEVNPFNPKNNVNYTQERSHVPTVVPSHPTWTENNFFWSVPSQESNLIVLNYQQKYVDKLLSISLEYDNVLYCMDNETSVTAEWGKFWATYIQKKAMESGKTVYTTEMWDPWNLDHIVHRETLDHPEIYAFADISQNNHNSGDAHWNNGIAQIQRLERHQMLRPLNNVKVYGNDGGRHQTTQNAIESFVRNVLFGAASTRFHRPTSGQGLNDIARAVIKSMRSLVDNTDFFNGKPANHLLAERSENEAFCRATPGGEYAIYFPKHGEVSLEINMEFSDASIEWLNIMESSWRDGEVVMKDEKTVAVETPAGDNWLALIKTR
jgi:hypothetical protein